MLEFAILGPLEVRCDARPLRLPGIASRRVLAALVLRAGEWTLADRLIDELWVERPPASARKALQMHVSRLRRALADAPDPDAAHALASGPAGYRLDVVPEQIDALRFARSLDDARRALAGADPERARELLVAGLALWRGPPLAELSLDGPSAAALARLEELRLVAIEQRVEADLQLGSHAELVAELQELVGEHPWRERLHAQLMLALYRSGRQADALDAYRRARRTLVEELGIEPEPQLRELQQAILGHDTSLIPPRPVARPIAGPPHARRASGLPAPPTRLIGRTREREQLVALLTDRDVRLVTLVGPGGVGKTRLALAAADAVQAAFHDGAPWVELAAVARPEHVIATIAAALPVMPVSGETGEDAVTRFLRPKRLLLAIDNFEHVIEAAPLIARLLAACPSLTALTTSRQALDLRAEHRHAVAPLSVPSVPERATEIELEQTEATALFLDAARRHGSTLRVTARNAPAIAEVCARLDGLPLALELAAARTTIMDPKQLATRLHDALSELASRARDVPERQRTLRATLEWSHKLLSAEERDAFARFAVFAGGATLDAAEAVTKASTDALTGLAAKQLLYRDDSGEQPRLAMLETVRAFALERLADLADSDVADRRHCDFYLALIERGDPTPFADVEPQWLAILDREIDNFRAALSWALANDFDMALKLTRTLGWYWVRRSNFEEGLPALQGVLEAAGPDTPARELVGIYSLRAELLLQADDIPAVEETARKTLELAREAADETAIATAWGVLVQAALYDRRGDEGRRYAHEALRHARATHDDRLIAIALTSLARSLPWPEGRPVYDEAVTLLTRVGYQRHLGQLHSNMAFGAIQAGHNEEASALLDDAMRLASELDDANLTAACLGNLGLSALVSGERERAREAFANELCLARQQGFLADASEGLVGLAAIAASEQDPRRTARLLGAARRISPISARLTEQVIGERLIDPVRGVLEASAWHSANEEGAQTDFAEAIRYALDEADP